MSMLFPDDAQLRNVNVVKRPLKSSAHREMMLLISHFTRPLGLLSRSILRYTPMLHRPIANH